MKFYVADNIANFLCGLWTEQGFEGIFWWIEVERKQNSTWTVSFWRVGRSRAPTNTEKGCFKALTVQRTNSESILNFNDLKVSRSIKFSVKIPSTNLQNYPLTSHLQHKKRKKNPKVEQPQKSCTLIIKERKFSISFQKIISVLFLLIKIQLF